MTVQVLSGGAVQGLVSALTERFEALTGHGIAASFGAVGAMRERFHAGDECDVLILTRAIIDELARERQVRPESVEDIGRISTAIAVRSADALPGVHDQAALSEALEAADEIYLPDPGQATAGRHFRAVLDALALAESVEGKLRTYPNGATAMREMAASTATRVIGCTQITEIVATGGVQPVASLPPGCELETIYTGAVTRRTSKPTQAFALVTLLGAEETRTVREQCGIAARG